jgi:protein LTV1
MTSTATYSNFENHPRIIRVTPSEPVPKILLDSRTGFPLTRELASTTALKTFVTKMEAVNKSDEELQEAGMWICLKKEGNLDKLIHSPQT